MLWKDRTNAGPDWGTGVLAMAVLISLGCNVFVYLNECVFVYLNECVFVYLNECVFVYLNKCVFIAGCGGVVLGIWWD